MTIIYRAQKGAPLTIEELDGNFKDLEKRLETVEDPASPEGGISHIRLEGDELVFEGSQGISLGRVRLPLPHFHGRGEWQPSNNYNLYDLVRYEDTLYLCLQAHQSNHFDQEREYWQILWQPPKSEFLFPKIPLLIESSLPLPDPGMIGLLIDADTVLPIYADGKAWRRFSDHQVVGEPS